MLQHDWGDLSSSLVKKEDQMFSLLILKETNVQRGMGQKHTNPDTFRRSVASQESQVALT